MQDVVLLLQKSERIESELVTELARQNYRVDTVRTIDDAAAWLRSNQASLVLVQPDAWPADASAWARLRRTTSAPVLAVGERERPKQVVQALEQGADLFVLHELGAVTIVAQAAAALRCSQRERTEAGTHPGAGPTAIYDDGVLRVDILRRRVTVHGEDVQLTPTEYRLLLYMVENVDIPLTFEQILSNVWGWETSERSYVHTYISQLRAKLHDTPDNPRHIFSEYGIGYVFHRMD